MHLLVIKVIITKIHGATHIKMTHLLNNQHTNVIVVNIPLRYDVCETSSINNEIKSFNGKSGKLTAKLNNTNVISAELARNFYTRHGIHMRNFGRAEVSNRLANKIRSLWWRQIEDSPISMMWKNNNKTPPKETQLQIPLTTTPSDIRSETTKKTQLPTRQRINLATKYQDFLWM
jgi:hypothetical protein